MSDNTELKRKSDAHKAKAKKQLGMNFGTATNRRRKQMMFDMVQRLGIDKCHKCGKGITTASD